MTTIHQRQKADENLSFECPSTVAFVKGAPDIILDLCKEILIDGKPIPITEEKKKEVLGINQDMARQAFARSGDGLGGPWRRFPRNVTATRLKIS